MSIASTLVEQHRYARSRLLGTLADIEKSEKATEALGWMMPFGKGRAHIAWQMMHCAATLDRYLNVRVLGKEPAFPDLVAKFAGGSESSAERVPTFAEIREALDQTAEPYFKYFETLSDEKLNQKANEAADRTQLQVMLLLNWHESHHQGQCHLIWNSFKAREQT
ncbi:MAG: DinB family protein [Leptospirales bacterium]|nr:DinB family protein [Leptospirales bacterium]